MKILKNYAFSLMLIAGVLLGGIAGAMFGDKTEIVKPIGDLFLNLMFVLIVPLVFFSVSSAICNIKQGGHVVGKLIVNIILVFLFTAIIAGGMAYVVTLFYNPFQGLSMSDFSIKSFDVENYTGKSTGDMFVGAVTVPDFVHLFSKTNLLPLIIFSILFGVAVSSLKSVNVKISRFLNLGTEIMLKMMGLVMCLAPIGLGCYFAYTVGQLGGQLLNGYLNAFVLYLVLAGVCYFVLNSIYAFIAGGKKALVLFWKNILTPSLTAIATASSAACISVNIEASKNIGVPSQIAETVIPLGTNMHKDGSVMGGILKIVFLISIFGHETALASNLFVIIGMAILVGAVMGAIPSGGMTGELLICSVFGFPPEMVGALMIISTIIDTPATLINSTGNIACSMLISRFTIGQKWLDQKS